jgi:hypothetical protein
VKSELIPLLWTLTRHFQRLSFRTFRRKCKTGHLRDRPHAIETSRVETEPKSLRLVATPPAFRLAPLGPIFFLSADESQTAPVLTNDARTLDSFGKAAKKLIKRFRIADLYVHAALNPSFPFEGTLKRAAGRCEQEVYVNSSQARQHCRHGSRVARTR